MGATGLRRTSLLFIVVFVAFLAASFPAGAQVITTVAGGGPNGVPALSANLAPSAVVRDQAGNLFIAAAFQNRVFKVDSEGQLTVVAGSGTFGFSGDGGPATAAELSGPLGIAVDSSGNLFIADAGNERIRRVDATTGIITTVAGNGTAGFSGDGGPAIGAGLFRPAGIAVDSSGNLFIGDSVNDRIRRVNATTGIITTVAGNGMVGFSGDGGPATSAELFVPTGVAVDSSGNLFIADTENARIRRVDATTGIITTVAGNGSFGFSGDGGPATSGELILPDRKARD